MIDDVDVAVQVSIFNETIMNIMENFAPNEIIICGDRNTLCMNRHIKVLFSIKIIFRKSLHITKTLCFISLLL